MKKDDEIIIDNRTVAGSETRFELRKGEKYKVDSLLYAILLPSSNEASTALAMSGGKVDAFVERMNKRAVALGATNTHFVNPHGLTAEGHYSTARDLALIAREAMQNEDFRRYVGTKKKKIPATNKQKERIVVNLNRLYNDAEKVTVYGEQRPITFTDTIGIKTGYTDAAGTCLAAAAQRNDVELISIVLRGDSTKVYQDTIALMEYGFHNFKAVTVFTKNKVQERIPVAGGNEKFVDGLAVGTVKATLPTSASAEEIEIRVKANEELSAPVTEGAIIGKAVAYLGDEKLCETPLKAGAAVKKSIFSASGGFISVLLKIVLIAAALLFLIIVVALIRANILRHKGAFSRRSKNDFTSREVKRVRRLK
jgi:D-alanyl-D-alanine carboxypeptidase (penicillin-binding protein 5/6)